MSNPHTIARSVALGAAVLLGAAGMPSCSHSSSTAVPTFSLPAPMGGLPPAEGSDLLDPSFATDGVLNLLDFSEDEPIRVATDRFSRVLIVGLGRPFRGLRVARVTEAGAADATFGQDGVSVVRSASGDEIAALRGPAISIDPLDRILLFHTRVLDLGGMRRAVVARLLPHGALDTDFGDQGEVVLAPSAEASEVLAASLLADPLGGVFACVDELGPEGSRMRVVRLDEDGRLDLAFGEGGIARGPESEESVGLGMTQDFAGRLTIAGALGSEPSRLALWRFAVDGLPDLGFGVDGLVAQPDSVASIGVRGVDLAPDGLGRIVVLGERSHDFDEIDDWPLQIVDFARSRQPLFDSVVWRFLFDGSPDRGFADGGERILGFNSGRYLPVDGGYKGGDHFEASAGLLVDDQDRIVVAGWSDPGLWDTILGFATFGPTRPFLVRLTASGALDSSFHGDGHVQLGWDNSGGFASALVRVSGHPTALTSDAEGRWLLAGGSNISERVWRVVP